MAREEKTVAQRRRMICQSGYHKKRMKHFKRQERFWARYVGSATRFTNEALNNMLRCHLKAEWYQKRAEMPVPEEASYDVLLTEGSFRSFARQIQLIPDLPVVTMEDALGKAGDIFNKVFGIIVPKEWME